MKDKKPLKRVAELIPFSKDHHHGLLLGWKIRTGLKKEVAIERISTYALWFYQNHLKPHFALEERFLFPILGSDDPLVKRACDEHRQMHSLMAGSLTEDNLQEVAALIEAHIRFEERELFERIQEKANPDMLAVIEKIHADSGFEEHPDEFWK